MVNPRMAAIVREIVCKKQGVLKIYLRVRFRRRVHLIGHMGGWPLRWSLGHKKERMLRS